MKDPVHRGGVFLPIGVIVAWLAMQIVDVV